jgi:hypothetical protein
MCIETYSVNYTVRTQVIHPLRLTCSVIPICYQFWVAIGIHWIVFSMDPHESIDIYTGGKYTSLLCTWGRQEFNEFIIHCSFTGQVKCPCRTWTIWMSIWPFTGPLYMSCWQKHCTLYSLHAIHMHVVDRILMTSSAITSPLDMWNVNWHRVDRIHWRNPPFLFHWTTEMSIGHFPAYIWSMNHFPQILLANSPTC